MSDLSSLKNLSLNDKITYARKRYGTQGYKCKVKANFAPVKIKPDKNSSSNMVYMYNIEISVRDVRNDGDSKKPQLSRIKNQKRMLNDANFDIFQRFYEKQAESGAESIFSSEPVFDGKKILYSKTKLKFKDGQDKGEYEVKVKVPEKKFLQTFIIRITTPKDSHQLDLMALNNPGRNVEKELQCFDIIITYGSKHFNLVYNSNVFRRAEDLIQDNRAVQRFDLGFLKEAGFGNYQAGKITENGIQLNVDRVAMVFNKGGRLLNLIEEYITESRNRGFRRGGPNQRNDQERVRLDDRFRFSQDGREIRELNEHFKNLSFTVDHLRFKPKNTFLLLSPVPIKEVKFDSLTDDHQKVSENVYDYFVTKYRTYLQDKGIKINPNWPAVQCGNKYHPTSFPIEVVDIMPDQYSFKKLNDRQQPTMTTKCGEQEPITRFQENESQIRNLMDSSRRCKTDYLSYFGIQLAERFPEIEARIIEGPEILGLNDKVKDVREGSWKDNSYSVPFVPTDFSWIVINFVSDRKRPIRNAPRDNEVDTLVKKLVYFANQNGFNLPNPATIQNINYENRAVLGNDLEDFTKKFKNLKFILFLIPSVPDDLYLSIKYLSEIEFGILTQCVSHSKNRKFGDPSYVNNLMLKINSKLGGINCCLASKRRNGTENKVGHLKKKTMIIGLDVTHPSKNDRIGNSIASVVATFDSKMVNYYCKTVVQPQAHLELVRLDEITVELLENFYKMNTKPGKSGFFPDYILVYRDGVSDGQFKQVMEEELSKMKASFLKISEKYKNELKDKDGRERPYEPKVTFIVVQKRHHTRFLPLNPRDAFKNNVKSGLVVDKSIVTNYFEYYLCSHAAGKGTSRPTRYIVLHDESDFSGDEIQKTTYYLTYLFTRCTKALSVPPPVQYSHLAAKRARLYLAYLDNNRGQIFGEQELNEDEILDRNRRIEVQENLKNTLYFV